MRKDSTEGSSLLGMFPNWAELLETTNICFSVPKGFVQSWKSPLNSGVCLKAGPFRTLAPACPQLQSPVSCLDSYSVCLQLQLPWLSRRLFSVSPWHFLNTRKRRSWNCKIPCPYSNISVTSLGPSLMPGESSESSDSELSRGKFFFRERNEKDSDLPVSQGDRDEYGFVLYSVNKSQ